MTAPSQKRKRLRACDTCRRKKIRCNGLEGSEESCSNCELNGDKCTYLHPTNRKEPTVAYVQFLEDRIRKMQLVVDKYENISEQSKNDADFRRADAFGATSPLLPTTLTRSIGKCLDNCFNPPLMIGNDLDSDEEDETLNNRAPQSKVYLVSDDNRWHGRSSGVQLLHTASKMRRAFDGANFSLHVLSSLNTDAERHSQMLRDDSSSIPAQVFPPSDLTRALFDLFFRYITPFLPVIHRTTFEAQYADRLHLRDVNYAHLLLMVFAVASIYSDDPRVYSEARGGRIPGYKYFKHVQDRTHSWRPARIPDLQRYVLEAVYHHFIGDLHVSWIVLGAGIRYAQDIGAHRKAPRIASSTVEAEMLKRTFWCMIALDRVVSSSLGQCLAVLEEDLDLDMPMDLPLEDSISDPNNVSYFVASLKLSSLLAIALRGIYSAGRRIGMFFGEVSESRVVALLDSALNRWLASVPEHLHWDPDRENLIHFEQSAELYATYYQIVIMIHRPFISTTGPSASGVPSLAICTSAARSCTRVVAALARRSLLVSTYTLYAAFASAVVLCINIWGLRKSQPAADVSELLSDVKECIFALRYAEKKWPSASKLVAVLRDLMDCKGTDLFETHIASIDSTSAEASINSNPRAKDGSNIPSCDYSGLNNTSDPDLTTSPPNALFENLAFDSFGPNNIWQTWAALSGTDEWQDWTSLINAANPGDSMAGTTLPSERSVDDF